MESKGEGKGWRSSRCKGVEKLESPNWQQQQLTPSSWERGLLMVTSRLAVAMWGSRTYYSVGVRV